MKQRYSFALVGAVFLFMNCGAVQADGQAPTNFGEDGYPRHECARPVPPYSNDPLDRQFFKRDLERYRQCIRAYARAARYDREHVEDRANQAVEEFNDFIRALDY